MRRKLLLTLGMTGALVAGGAALLPSPALAGATSSTTQYYDCTLTATTVRVGTSMQGRGQASCTKSKAWTKITVILKKDFGPTVQTYTMFSNSFGTGTSVVASPSVDALGCHYWQTIVNVTIANMGTASVTTNAAKICI